MERDECNFEDFLPCEDVEVKMDCERVIGALEYREKQILYLYVCGHTQDEIGAMVGLSQRHVGRILANMSKSAEKVACRY